MTGEYNVKIKPYPEEKTWRNVKMLSVEFTIDVDNKKHIFKGLITEEG